MILSGAAAVARKEIRHIFRDKQILFMTVIAPSFVLFLLAYTFAADSQLMRIGVMDRDQSAVSRRLAAFTASDGFARIEGRPADYDEAEAMIRRAAVSAVLVIPHGFGESLVAGRPIPLQAVIDGSDPFLSASTYGDLSLRCAAFGTQMARDGISPAAATVEVTVRALYNPALKWIKAMVPGLMAASFIFPAIAVALACTRELERGSYEALLATPIRTYEYMLGKLLPYLVFGTVGTVGAYALARLWFKVPFRGQFTDFMLVTAVFMLSLMSLSLLVGTAAGNQRQAVIIIVMAFFIPTFFMSGLLTPLAPDTVMSRVVQLVLPAANYVPLNRAVFLKGVSASAGRDELVNMWRIAAVSLTATYALSRRHVR